VAEPPNESPAPDRVATLPAETQRTPAREQEPQRLFRPAIAPTNKEPRAVVPATEPQEQVAAATPPLREITTDFLPLVYGDDLSSYEGARLVRVRLPSEALTYFGLPAHGSYGERVPADVLLDEDGTARAVRFVRYARTGGAEMRRGSGF
jgi:hypothetical protein